MDDLEKAFFVRQMMRGRILLFVFLPFLLLIGACKTGVGNTPEQTYDMIEYTVNSADWVKCEERMEVYGDEEITKEILNDFEQWVVMHTAAKIFPARGKTKEEITDLFFRLTSISRDEISRIFQQVDVIGKYMVILKFQSGSGDMDIVFIEKI